VTVIAIVAFAVGILAAIWFVVILVSPQPPCDSHHVPALIFGTTFCEKK
jgi:hypothetical protein